MLFDAQTFHALPEAGGLLDQPAGLLKRMWTVGRIYYGFKAYRQYALVPGEGTKWKMMNPEIMRLVSYVRNNVINGESVTA
jgi:hypothetical protein